MKKYFKVVYIMASLILLSVVFASCKNDKIIKNFNEFATSELKADEYDADSDDFYEVDGKGHVFYTEDKKEIKHFLKCNEFDPYNSRVYCSAQYWDESDIDALAWYNRDSDTNGEWVLVAQFSNNKEAANAFKKFTDGFNQNVGINVTDLPDDQYSFDGKQGKLLINLKHLRMFYWLLNEYDTNGIPVTYDDAVNTLELLNQMMPEFYTTYLIDNCIVCAHYDYMEDDFDNVTKISNHFGVDNPKDAEYDPDLRLTIVDYLVKGQLGRSMDELDSTISDYGTYSASQSGSSSSYSFPCTISASYFGQSFSVKLDYKVSNTTDGKKVFIVLADYTNNSTDSLHIFATDYSCYVDNSVCKVASTVTVDGLSRATEISSGRSGKICSAFYIPSDAKNVEIDFTVPDMSGDTTYTISANIG